MNERIKAGLEADNFQMDPDAFRRTIHVILQSKGGAGKTYVAGTLGSFFQLHVPLPLYCYDLDSTNEFSFSSFKSLNVRRLSDIDMETMETDATRFDDAFNQVLEPDMEDGILLLDTGASSYMSVLRYLMETDYPSLAALSEKPWRFLVHIVVSAADMKDCTASLQYMHRNLENPYVEYVMWGNEYFGPLDAFYADNMIKYERFFMDKNVLLPPVSSSLAPHLKKMRERGMTAREIMEDPELKAIERARVRQYFYGHGGGRGGVFRQLANVNWNKA